VLLEGETKNALQHFLNDPYGCYPPLSTKKAGRNPFHREPPYRLTCPEMDSLLQYCGRTYFPYTLPWERSFF